MRAVYPVIFTETNDEKDTVLVEVPDFKVYTEGYGITDAMQMARDAIGLSGITIEDMGKELPKPMDISQIDITYGEFHSEGKGFISLVDIDFAFYRRQMDNKTVRRNVTLPNWLNQEAEKAGINVSKVLQEALVSVLNVKRNV